MILKWALVSFAVAALGLYLLTKVITFLNPPRPGRPAPLVLRRVRRALGWTVVVPVLLGLVILALTLSGRL